VLTVHCERVTPFGGPPFAWTETPVTRAFRGKPNAGAPGAVSRDGVAAGENGGRTRGHNSLVVNTSELWV
jgi:hypothetical protein